MNQVILEGIVEREAEVRYFAYNHLRVGFVLRTEEFVETQTGERKALNLYHQIVVWAPEVAKYAEEHIRIGQRLRIQGRITYERYNKGEESNTQMQIECLSLSILDDTPSKQRDKPSAPIVEIDWGSFSPQEGEDPMA